MTSSVNFTVSTKIQDKQQEKKRKFLLLNVGKFNFMLNILIVICWLWMCSLWYERRRSEQSAPQLWLNLSRSVCLCVRKGHWCFWPHAVFLNKHCPWRYFHFHRCVCPCSQNRSILAVHSNTQVQCLQRVNLRVTVGLRGGVKIRGRVKKRIKVRVWLQ